MQVLKLKSKTLINFFGQDTITPEEMQELIIYGDGAPIDEQEALLLQEDLLACFKMNQNISEFQLNNIDMANISISKILKECRCFSSNISFDGSNEYFDCMRDTQILLSEWTRQQLGLDQNQEI